jgi:predicted nucleic acid-binding protein
VSNIFLDTNIVLDILIAKRQDVIRDALTFSLKHGADLEDVLQCFCAKKHRCRFLSTSDRSFAYCGVDILYPELFLEKRRGV